MSVVDHDICFVQIVVGKHYPMFVGVEQAIQATFDERFLVINLYVNLAECKVEFPFTIEWTW